MDIRTFRNGEIVVRQGEQGDCMYVILSGTVGIFREYGSELEYKIAELGPGDFMGEMELIEKGGRSATGVVLSESAELERITEENYLDFFENNPVQVYLIMKQLSERLRQTTQNYTNACRAVYELVQNRETGEEPSLWLRENEQRFCGSYQKTADSGAQGCGTGE